MTLTSWKAIADMALLKLNRNKLESSTWPPTGRDKNDEAVFAFWDTSFEHVLLDHDWSDAIDQWPINIDSPDDRTYQNKEGLWAGSLARAQAQGLIKIRWVYPTQNWRQENDFLFLESIGTYLLTEEGTKYVIIRGVKKILPSELKSPHLAEALALQLAYRLAPLLRPDRPDIEQKLWQQYQAKILESRNRTALDQKDQERPTLFRQRAKLWIE